VETRLVGFEESRLCAMQSKGGSLAGRLRRDSTCRAGCSMSRPWRILVAVVGHLPLLCSSWAAVTCADGHGRIACSSRHCSLHQVGPGLA